MKKILLILTALFCINASAQTVLSEGRIDTIWGTGQVPKGSNLMNTFYTIFKLSDTVIKFPTKWYLSQNYIPISNRTALAMPSTTVFRDASANAYFNNTPLRLAKLTTSNTKKVLTVASGFKQQVTGSTDTIQLPDATTLHMNHSFVIDNRSATTLRVTDATGAQLKQFPVGGVAIVGVTDTTTAAGVWEMLWLFPHNVNNSIGSSAISLASSLTIQNGFATNVDALTATTFNGNSIQTGTGTLNLNTYSVTATGNATVSGVNTGDQTITLTGAVTGSGTNTIVTTLQPFSVATATIGTVTATTITTSSLTTTAAILPVVQTSSTSTITPSQTANYTSYGSSSTAFVINNPSTTFADGQGFSINIKDNGTARAISFGNGYVAMGQALPTTTTISKWMTIYFIYNSTYAKYQTWYANEQ